jgi:hypothetical protein
MRSTRGDPQPFGAHLRHLFDLTSCHPAADKRYGISSNTYAPGGPSPTRQAFSAGST